MQYNEANQANINSDLDYSNFLFRKGFISGPDIWRFVTNSYTIYTI